MTPFDPALIRSFHDERRRRLRRTRQWAEDRPTRPAPGRDHAFADR